MPDPWPEGIRRGFPAGAIFRREPGLQRGRRRAPFARSREGGSHIKAALWRTERVHRPGLFPFPGIFPKRKRWVRSAYPPYETGRVIDTVGALRLPTLRTR